METDADKDFLRSLENGETVGYNSDLWNSPGFFPYKTNRRVFGAAREFLGNY